MHRQTLLQCADGIFELAYIPMVVDVSHLGRLVEEARRIVWEQKGRIIRLRAAGRDTWDAERTLQLLEANLQKLREYKQTLEGDSLVAAE
jgi:hypothetical protein